MDKDYIASMKLHDFLGDLRTSSNHTIKDELSYLDVSFWEIVAPYMVLYRYPLLFSKNSKSSKGLSYFKEVFRPLYGRLQHKLQNRKRKTFSINYSSKNRTPTPHSAIHFLGFIPNFYSTILHPVVGETAKSSEFECVTVEDFPFLSGKNSNSEDHYFESIWEYWDPKMDELSRRMSKRIVAIFKSVFCSPEFHSRVKSEFPTMDVKSLKRELGWLFQKDLQFLTSWLQVVFAYLKYTKPSLIVTADDSTLKCRSLTLCGKKLGIPSLLIQQGLVSRQNPEWLYFTCTKFAAMGVNAYDEVRSLGVPAEDIEITGSAAYDRLNHNIQEVCQKTRAHFKIAEHKKLITFFSQPYYVKAFINPEIRIQMILDLIDVSKSIKNAQFIVKTHPSEDIKEMKNLFKGSSFVISDGAVDTSALIQSSDIVLTFFSTCALEALYLRKPVINLHYPNSTTIDLFKQSMATWIAHDKTSLLEALCETIEKNERVLFSKAEHLNKFVRDYAMSTDGQASKRIYDLMRRCRTSEHKFVSGDISQ